MHFPEVIEEKDIQKQSLVSSCSECNMEYIDGHFNVQGYLHRQLYMTEWGLDCRKCPVFQNMSPKEFEQILADMDGEE